MEPENTSPLNLADEVAKANEQAAESTDSAISILNGAADESGEVEPVTPTETPVGSVSEEKPPITLNEIASGNE